MKKKIALENLKSKGTVKRSRKQPFHYTLTTENETYNVFIFKISDTHQLTINSPKVIELAKGKLYGIKYKKTNSMLYRWDDKSTKVIIILLETPYRILKYINENEIVDISKNNIVHNISLIHSISDIQSIN